MKQIHTIINLWNQLIPEYLPYISSHKGLRKKEHDKEAMAKNNGHDTGREKEKLTATY